MSIKTSLSSTEKAGMVGALIVIISTFLPWATLATVFGMVSFYGIETGDGVMILVIAAILIVAIFLGGSHKFRHGLMLLFGVILGFIHFVNAISIEEQALVMNYECLGFCRLDLGIGLLLGFLASLVIVVCGLKKETDAPTEAVADHMLPVPVFCTKCKSPNDPTMKFCGYCGTPL